jgi:lipid-A-disaccharide synthase
VSGSPVALPRPVAVVAGEASGDQLGVRLMAALRRRLGDDLPFVGVGGPLMSAAGLRSFFPMDDIAVNGFMPVVRRLPSLLARIATTADRLAELRPAVAVLIDSPDFNHRVARRLRRLAPGVPIIGYVSPTVWAWRPGRARKIRPLMDHLMALLPFEPEAHARLGGPPTTYVGHPLIERLESLRPGPDEAARRGEGPFTLLVMPGSRQSEVRRLMPAFGETVDRLRAACPDLEVAVPAVPHLAETIRAAAASWPARPEIVLGEQAKLAAFRRARAALTKSGTVTLELALAGVPMVVAYKVGYVEGEIARRLISIDVASLPNLILGRKAIPEFIDRGWDSGTLAATVAPLLAGGAEREAQLAAFAQVEARMAVGGLAPSDRAAEIVIAAMRE